MRTFVAIAALLVASVLPASAGAGICERPVFAAQCAQFRAIQMHADNCSVGCCRYWPNGSCAAYCTSCAGGAVRGRS